MRTNPSTLPTNFQEPPSSNTGAQNTEIAKQQPTQNDREALVDYIAGTFPDGTGLERVAQLLGLQGVPGQKLLSGRNGYRQGATFGQLRVYYDGNDGMGYHFEGAGQACRELEARHGAEYWVALHDQVVSEGGGKFTRADLAIDDRTGDFDLGRVALCADDWDNQVRSRWREESGGLQRGWGKSAGATLYFGARQSNAFLRMYDKTAQLRKQATLPPEVLAAMGPCARVELELKGSQANQAMEWLGMGMEVGKIVVGLIKGKLNFIEPDADDTNKARWPVAAWWEQWLGDVQKLKLTTAPRVVKTVEQVKSWLRRQVAPSLAAVSECFQRSGLDFGAYLNTLVENGSGRLKEHHWLMIGEVGTCVT